MVYNQFSPEEGVWIHSSLFRGDSASEYHLMITPAAGGTASLQFRQIENALARFIQSQSMNHPVVFFQRFFASDLCNQEEILRSGRSFSPGSLIAAIQQPPAGGNKLVAWVYLVDFLSGSVEIQSSDFSYRILRNGYDHLFTAGLVSGEGTDSHSQTLALFDRYLAILKDASMTLEANCIRTWIFVRDIDNHYQGMVKARNEVFSREGLTASGHFIASTGIEGQTAVPHSLVGLDAYALGGIVPSQVRFLKGSSHLSPTPLYGVAFERGTTVDYGDRRHVFISGTASIDHRGGILHPQDIGNQTRRVFENIEVLLAEAGACYNDVTSMIVYLRDLADRDFIGDYLRRHYPDVPRLVTLAPICRHGWLVEVECTAALKASNAAYRDF